MKKFLLAALVGLIPSPLAAQAAHPKACGSTGPVTIEKLATCIDSLAARLRQLESASTSRAAVVEGDLVVKGRMCIGRSCGPDVDQIQIWGQSDADILFVSNLAGNNPQSPKEHYSRITLSGDGGLRLINNGRQGHPAEKRAAHIGWDTERGYGQHGFDSQGNWSMVQRAPGAPGDYTQDLVLNVEEWSKTVWFTSWRPGWKVGFRTSTCITCFDLAWIAPVMGGDTRPQPVAPSPLPPTPPPPAPVVR